MSSPRPPRSFAVGSLLREYRIWDGYSRRSLAEHAGLSAEQLENWEILGVPVPIPTPFLEVAKIVGIPGSAIDAALSGREPRLPRDPIEVYDAEAIIEDAIADHGWAPDEIAQVLATSPTKVQAWRLGALEMAHAERSALADLLRIRHQPPRSK